jgi:hypothetical protein
MFVNTNQIQIGAANFIRNEIAPKAAGRKKFATYFILEISRSKRTVCRACGCA